MPFNTGGALSGAASGAAAGSSFGPWGAAIGGGIGLLSGGLSGGSSGPAPLPPTMAAPATPGAVTGTYGGSYINPITGQVTYASNTAMPSSTSMYNQNLMSQLMGYGGTGQDISRQVAAQQATLDRLKAQGVGKASLGDYISKDSGWIDPKTGGVVDYQQFINKRGADNPLWTEFMRATGGNFGSSNPDISFSNWAKADYQRNVAPAVESLHNAEKTLQGNQAAYDQQLAGEQQKLASLQDYQSQMGGASASAAQNPLLAYLNNGPDQSNYLQNQMTTQYKNAELANQQGMAKRGMGSSAMSEIGSAGNRLGLAQGIQGAQIQAGQQNLGNRMTMLNYLSGQNAQEQQNQLGKENSYNQQMGMGQGVAQNMAGAITNQQAANAGMGWQGQMAGFNANQAQGMANQNAWGSTVNALGANANNISTWLKEQNDMQNAGSAGTAYNAWMGANAGKVPYAGD